MIMKSEYVPQNMIVLIMFTHVFLAKSLCGRQMLYLIL